MHTIAAFTAYGRGVCGTKAADRLYFPSTDSIAFIIIIYTHFHVPLIVQAGNGGNDRRTMYVDSMMVAWAGQIDQPYPFSLGRCQMNRSKASENKRGK